MAKLILIDGSSYLYRAFHALPPLSNAQGEPTGALFGVVNMLRTTLKEQPDYVAFVSDAPGPSFRNALYAAYKANRPPMPDDLRAQVQPMLDIVAALGFPILRVDGVEADDVIGTLALEAQARGIEVEISTSDKDFAQLVRPGITLVNTMTSTVTDRDGVITKFGVPPERIVDFLALTGDSIDNVPGVSKCGPKTAAKWLAEYGSLDGVIEHAGDIGGKIGESLREALPQLPLSRELVTIKTDVTLNCGVTDLAPKAKDTDTLRTLFTRYEFKQALKELDGDTDAGSTPAPGPASAATAAPASHEAPSANLSAKGDYELVTTQAQLDAWLIKLERAELIAFDTETTSLDAMQAEIVGASFAVESGHACYIPLAHDYPGAPAQLDRAATLAALKPILEDPQRPKLGQHAKYDMNVLSQYGIVVRGLKHDTMLESFVWNATATRHDMDSLASRYLGYETIKYEQVAGKGAKQISFSQVDLETARDYAAEDADITLRLHHALWPRLQGEPSLRKVYEEIEIPLVPVLARMEQRGVLIDVDELRRQSQQLGKRMHEIQQQAYAEAGRDFNLDSPKQLQAILFDELGLAAKVKTPKGQPSTNEEALEAIADEHALPRLILDYRGLAKLRSTYTDKLSGMVNPRTGRVHTSYHQGGAATGRISSSDPNLQNIPVRTEEGRRIRQAFIAPEGWRVMAADYSQIELRIMAHLSGDEGLLKAFHEGGDVHRATAAEVFGLPPEEVSANQRRAAKAINFGLMYGMSAFGLARQLGVDRGEAGDYMARYFARYPGVHAFMEATRAQAHRDGYVQTIFGRRLYLENLTSRNQALRQGAERAAVNAPMQGSAADIIKRAMIAVDGWLGGRDDARMLMQVHDELVFEVRTDAVDAVREGVVARMSGAAELKVPLLVDVGVGANWDEAH
ncbi:MAG: DNA polymerase I [Lysobacterales bacterium 14-68-21]|nr:MAG: DNA polymerase I [Xanthomonadales bacterium 15-68-25]OZB67863.1 MAG: DNA polymerase I [Xanthomonadales bacterium 14-68-21]